MRRLLFGTVLLLTTSLPAVSAAGVLHPVESLLQRSFPSLHLESSARFESAQLVSNGEALSGLRVVRAGEPEGARTDRTLSVLYPRWYDGLLVATLGSQKVVLRASGAAAATAAESNGKLIYEQPYPSVDAVEVPRGGRSEELLLLRDARAPRTFQYEIVSTEGVSGVMLHGGAIRFLPGVEAGETATSQASRSRFTSPSGALQIDRPWLIDGSGRRSEGRARWSLVGGGAIPKAIRLTVEVDGDAFPVVVDPSFSAAGMMGEKRMSHVAILLPNGKVLIAGGYRHDGYNVTAELYDPSTGTFSWTGWLVSDGWWSPVATLLPDGKVLLAGCWYSESAEVYDPATGEFTELGGAPALTDRRLMTATLLKNGKVLFTGGQEDAGVLLGSVLFDPATGTTSDTTGDLVEARFGHTATLLPDGKVLIAGGKDAEDTVLDSAELYDPESDQFTAITDPLGSARQGHTATLLPTGDVLITGGFTTGDLPVASAELFDPDTSTFSDTAASMSTERAGHSTTLLPDGKVLVAGGVDSGMVSLASAELYDPGTGTFSGAGNLSAPRAVHTATLLPDGDVLIAGGGEAGPEGDSLVTADLYEPADGGFTTAADAPAARTRHSATPLPNGNVIIAGGYEASYLRTVQIYDSAGGTLGSAENLTEARAGHTATLLVTGNVLIAGGENESGYVATSELRYGSGAAAGMTGDLGTARASHTATLLRNGNVLVAGGESGTGCLSSAEIYDPVAGTFSKTGGLAEARLGHTATLLPNARVLIAGGSCGSTTLASAEVYDPLTGQFSAIPGGLLTARSGHTATLLPTGQVLIAGGHDGAEYLVSAELYDPGTGTFSVAPILDVRRANHTATLLGNNKVLMAGGVTTAGSHLTFACVYDLALGCRATGTLNAPRSGHGATLLPGGTVLITGGTESGGGMAPTEVFDRGLGFAESRRPIVDTAPETLALPGTLSITGSGFRDEIEGSSGGGANHSATNFPLLQLQRIGNEHNFFVTPSSAPSDTSWSGELPTMAAGCYRLTVFVNGVPSVQRIVRLTLAAPTIIAVSPSSGPAAGEDEFSIEGTNLNGVTVMFGGRPANVTKTEDDGATGWTPRHQPGTVDVVVTTPDGLTATAPGAYTFVVAMPTGLSAAAVGPTTVLVTWTAPPDAGGYEVLRSSDGIHYTALVPPTSATSYSDGTAASGAAYLYKARVIAPFTSDSSLPDLATTVVFADDPLAGGATVVRAVHLTQLRTAVTALWTLAGQGGSPFVTDPAITPGLTPIRAAHFAELRASIDAARSALGLPAVTYARPSPTAGATIDASDVSDLRAGVK